MEANYKLDPEHQVAINSETKSDNGIRFSCIITCFNREKLIQRSILSILNQSYTNFEIIVVDDCSTDDSIGQILALNDERIHLVKHKENRGQNAALNSGIKNARFEYLAFLDSDDEWLPDFLREMHDSYVANPSISFAYAACVRGPSAGLEGVNKYAETLDQGYLSAMITITAKTEAVHFIGNFDERYTICQDDDFCFRLAKNFSFKAIPKPLALIHGDENSMTRNLLKVAEGWAFLFKNYKQDIIDYCGYKTLAKHHLNISLQFFIVKEFKKGLHYYFSAFRSFIKSDHKNKFNYPLQAFLHQSWIILKLNLGHIKRLILNNNDRRS